MKRARSGKAFARLRALSVQVLGRSQRDQLKHARNDHARIVAVACGSLGSGGRRPADGLGWRDGGARGPARACSRGSGACRARARGQGAAGNDLVRHAMPRFAEIFPSRCPFGCPFGCPFRIRMPPSVRMRHSGAAWARCARPIRMRRFGFGYLKFSLSAIEIFTAPAPWHSN